LYQIPTQSIAVFNKYQYGRTANCSLKYIIVICSPERKGTQ